MLFALASIFFVLNVIFQIKYVIGNDYLVVLTNSTIYLLWFYFGYATNKSENNIFL